GWVYFPYLICPPTIQATAPAPPTLPAVTNPTQPAPEEFCERELGRHSSLLTVKLGYVSLYQTAETLTHPRHRSRLRLGAYIPLDHRTFCNGCPGGAARSMSQGLRVLVLIQRLLTMVR